MSDFQAGLKDYGAKKQGQKGTKKRLWKKVPEMAFVCGFFGGGAGGKGKRARQGVLAREKNAEKTFI